MNGLQDYISSIDPFTPYLDFLLLFPNCSSDTKVKHVNFCRTYISHDSDHILLINRVICKIVNFLWASLVAQLVENPPAMWETWV